MKRIRIAQIGIGHDHSISTAEPLKNYSEEFEFVGYTPVEDEWERFPQYHNFFGALPRISLEQILNDPTIEAVAIETEEVNLTKYAYMALLRGKHVHMDKPGGLDLALFEKTVALAKEKGLVFHVGYMYRYNPYVIQIMEQIKNGDFGQVYAVEAHMDCRHSKEKRQWLSTFPGGMLFFLGCHLIDLIYRIKGEPEQVLPLSMPTGLDGVTADDYGMVVYKYKDGISFAKTCASETGGFARRQLVVLGSKKTVELKPFEFNDFEKPGLQYTEKTEYKSEAWTDAGEKSRCESFSRMGVMMSRFRAYVAGEEENPYTYDYELGLYRLLLRSLEK